jgi:hypothetical protein
MDTNASTEPVKVPISSFDGSKTVDTEPPLKKRARVLEDGAPTEPAAEEIQQEQEQPEPEMKEEVGHGCEDGSEKHVQAGEEGAGDLEATLIRMTEAMKEQSGKLDVVIASLGELNQLTRQMGTTYAQATSSSLAYLGQLMDHHFARLIQAVKGESVAQKQDEVVVEKVVQAEEKKAAGKPKKAAPKQEGFTVKSLLASEASTEDLEHLAGQVEATFPLNHVCWEIDSHGYISGAALSGDDQNPAGKVEMKAEVLGRHFYCVAAREEEGGGWLRIRASQGLTKRDSELITMLQETNPDALQLCLTMAAASPTQVDERCRAKVTGNEGAKELVFPPVGLLEPYSRDFIFLGLVRAVEEFGGCWEAVRAVGEVEEHKHKLVEAAEYVVEVGQELSKLLEATDPVGLGYPSDEIVALAEVWQDAEGVEIAGVAHFAMMELARMAKGTLGTNAFAKAIYRGVQTFLGPQKDRYVPTALAREFLAPFVMLSVHSTCDEIDRGEWKSPPLVKGLSTPVARQILGHEKLRTLLIRFVAGRATQKAGARGPGTSAFVSLANYVEKNMFVLLLEEASHYALRAVTLSAGQGRGLLETLEDAARAAAWYRFSKGYRGEKVEGLHGVGALPWLAVYRGPPVLGDYLQTQEGARGITWLVGDEDPQPFIHGDDRLEAFIGTLPKEAPSPRLYGEWNSYAELEEALRLGVVRSCAEIKGERATEEETSAPPAPQIGFGQEQPSAKAQAPGGIPLPTIVLEPAQPK